MPVSAKSFFEVVERVRRRELMISSPVLLDVGSTGRVADSKKQYYAASMTRTTADHDVWFLSYASEYSDNPCYVLDAGRIVTIGRSRSCDLRISHKSVSSLHARLRYERSSLRYFVADEGSRNGTHVAGERLSPGVETPIWSGVILAFGQTAYIFLTSPTIRKLAALAASSK